MNVFSSIRARFTGWYLAVLTVLLIAMSIGTYVVLRNTLNANLDTVLTRRADELLRQPDFVLQLLDDRFQPPLGEVIGLFVPSDEGWEAIGLRLPDESIAKATIEAAAMGMPSHVTIDAEDEPPIRYFLIRYLPQAAPPDGLPDPRPPTPPGQAKVSEPTVLGLDKAILVVGRPADVVISALGALRNTLLLAVPLTLLLSAGGGLFLIRRALRPVDTMIATTRTIEETDLSRRISVQSHDELGRLSQTLNSMLNRLEEAFARQRQFTDDASHELRTPLSVIEAEATLALRRDRTAEEYRETLATIAEESVSMHRLINQLLTLARSDATDQESLETEDFDLGAIIIDVAAALRPLAQERSIALSTETSPLHVMGDPIRVRRLIVNLMDNAIRYTEPSGLVTATLVKEGGLAVFRVKDTGIGIAPEHLDTVFERFARADSSRHRGSEANGSGLGLAICRQIVQLHGGTIEVESTPGQGSIFTVRLQLAAN